jgi:hypothetical protein
MSPGWSWKNSRRVSPSSPAYIMFHALVHASYELTLYSPVWNGWSGSPCALPTIVRNCCVLEAMELDHRSQPSRGIALGVQPVDVCVKCAVDSSECCELPTNIFITRKRSDEATAIRLASSVDSIRVDAVLGPDERQHVFGELEVLLHGSGGVGRARPRPAIPVWVDHDLVLGEVWVVEVCVPLEIEPGSPVAVISHNERVLTTFVISGGETDTKFALHARGRDGVEEGQAMEVVCFAAS